MKCRWKWIEVYSSWKIKEIETILDTGSFALSAVQTAFSGVILQKGEQAPNYIMVEKFENIANGLLVSF